MTDIHDIELFDCPMCQGPGVLEDENGWVYVMCMDCGCHTGEYPYDKDKTIEEAAQQAALMWNIGKVISHSPGE